MKEIEAKGLLALWGRRVDSWDTAVGVTFLPTRRRGDCRAETMQNTRLSPTRCPRVKFRAQPMKYARLA
jgi:hypothetical protein